VKPVLIIGVGNVAAGDDAAGPAVARRFEGQRGVGVRIVHQLSPELAAEVASAGRVIFVDAGATGGRLAVRPLAPMPASPALTHAFAPESVLELARVLYGGYPPAFLVMVPGRRFGHRVGLSAAAIRQIPAAVRAVRRLLRAAGRRADAPVGTP
jgi:hydrogenase maturation protease